MLLKFLFSLRAFQIRLSKRVEWMVVCANTSRRSCDFSEANLYYWGAYLLRVRADANGTLSESEHLKFLPDKHGERQQIATLVTRVKGQE